MNFINHQPREKDKRNIDFDGRPPEVRATLAAIEYFRTNPVHNIPITETKGRDRRLSHRVASSLVNESRSNRDITETESEVIPNVALGTMQFKPTETESEVMPPARARSETSTNDTRPPAYLGADRLDEIATRVRLLTYGQMMQLSEETGISAEAFHKWSRQ